MKELAQFQNAHECVSKDARKCKTELPKSLPKIWQESQEKILDTLCPFLHATKPAQEYKDVP